MKLLVTRCGALCEKIRVDQKGEDVCVGSKERVSQAQEAARAMQAAGHRHVQRAWGRRGLGAPASWEDQEGGCEGSRGRGRHEAYLEK